MLRFEIIHLCFLPKKKTAKAQMRMIAERLSTCVRTRQIPKPHNSHEQDVFQQFYFFE